ADALSVARASARTVLLMETPVVEVGRKYFYVLNSCRNDCYERREQLQQVLRLAGLEEIVIEAHQRGEQAIGALGPLPGDGDEQRRPVEAVHLAQLTRDCESADARHLDI